MDIGYLEELCEAVIDASRVPPEASVGEFGPNSTGGTLIRPGGRECYPAFWIRDFAMSLDSGCISPEEVRHAILLTGRHQCDVDRTLRSGSVVPAGSIPDHVSFDGKAIYFPGTIDDEERQGRP